MKLIEMMERLVEGRVHDELSVVDEQGNRYLLKARLRPYLPAKGTRVGFVPNKRAFRGRQYALDFVSAEVLDRVQSIRS